MYVCNISGTTSWCQFYKSYKNKLTTIMRNAEKKYYSNMLTQVKGDITNTWTVLKNVINKSIKRKSPNGNFEHNGVSINDPDLICKTFNEFFTNIGHNLASKIPKVDVNPLHYIKGEYYNSMFVEPTTPEEICELIKKEKINKASGFDDISINVIKHVSQYICDPLTKIFNESFVKGIVTNQLKIAKVIPVFKSVNCDELSNYRPVSLLPTFSKILERLFYNRLIKYIN